MILHHQTLNNNCSSLIIIIVEKIILHTFRTIKLFYLTQENVFYQRDVFKLQDPFTNQMSQFTRLYNVLDLLPVNSELIILQRHFTTDTNRVKNLNINFFIQNMEKNTSSMLSNYSKYIGRILLRHCHVMMLIIDSNFYLGKDQTKLGRSHGLFELI